MTSFDENISTDAELPRGELAVRDEGEGINWTRESLSALREDSLGAFLMIVGGLVRRGQLDQLEHVVTLPRIFELKREATRDLGTVKIQTRSNHSIGVLLARAVTEVASPAEHDQIARKSAYVLKVLEAMRAADAMRQQDDFIRGLIAFTPNGQAAVLKAAIQACNAEWVTTAANATRDHIGGTASIADVTWLGQAVQRDRGDAMVALLEMAGSHGMPARDAMLQSVGRSKVDGRPEITDFFRMIGRHSAGRCIEPAMKAAGATGEEVMLTLEERLGTLAHRADDARGTSPIAGWELIERSLAACLECGAGAIIAANMASLSTLGSAEFGRMRRLAKHGLLCLSSAMTEAFGSDGLRALLGARALPRAEGDDGQARNAYMLVLHGWEHRADRSRLLPGGATAETRAAAERGKAFRDEQARQLLTMLSAGGFVDGAVSSTDLGSHDAANERLARNQATTLHVACARGDIEFAKIMVELGWDPEARDLRGWTAYSHLSKDERPEFMAYCASLKARRAVTRALNEAGGDPGAATPSSIPVSTPGPR